jgi:hypothetical protein
VGETGYTPCMEYLLFDGADGTIVGSIEDLEAALRASQTLEIEGVDVRLARWCESLVERQRLENHQAEKCVSLVRRSVRG